jgi:hypothetical protein
LKNITKGEINMDTTNNQNVFELAITLGKALKEDERLVRMQKAREEFEGNEQLSTLMTEYEVQQKAMENVAGGGEFDPHMVQLIQDRIDAIYRQVTAMADGDFSDSDLENAKNSIIRSLHSMEGSLSSINSYMLGQLILEDAATLDQNIEYVSKVTREEVIAVAKTVLPELEYILCGEGEQ